MNTETQTYRIPPRFYLDHLARDCGKGGKIIKQCGKYIIVDLDTVALDDLTSDALYYIECADTFDPPMTGLIASARATLKAIKENK